MDCYMTIAAPACAEYVEKRSRFLSQIVPLRTSEEAAAFLAETKSRHRDARHNCSAYILRAGGAQRYSDDGEPQGTAGIPMLEVLKKERLTDVAVVVTRYFGGILLGAGGLARAYSHSAKLAVDAARRVEMRPCRRLSLPVDYAAYGRVEALLQAFGAQLLDSVFGEAVTLHALLEEDKLAAFCAELTERTAGTVTPVLEEQMYVPFSL